MKDPTDWLPYLNLGLIIAGFVLLLRQLKRQQRLGRLEFLSALRRPLVEDTALMDLFMLCERAAEGPEGRDLLAQAPPREKLRLLALLEEIALYADDFEIDRNHSVHLTQWLAHYAFNDPAVSEAFWRNMGGVEERAKPYWTRSRSFSKSFTPA